MVALALPDHDEGEAHHREERDHLEDGEDRADPLPVARRADPEIVVTRAEDAGKERGRYDDVEPLLDHLAVDAGQFQHQETEDGGHHQLPGRLDPEVDHEPPIHLVERQVVRVDEGEDPEQRQEPQPKQQDVGNCGLAPRERGQRDIGEKDQRGDEDADLHPERLLEELAPAMNADEIAADGAERADDEDRQLEIGELHRKSSRSASSGSR